MKKFYPIILILICLILNLFPQVVFAQREVVDGLVIIKEPLGMPSGDIRVMMSAIINQVIAYMGIVFVVIILYAGFLYLFSMGDEVKTKKARDTITGGIIGLVLIFTSYSIASFVISSIQEATT